MPHKKRISFATLNGPSLYDMPKKNLSANGYRSTQPFSHEKIQADAEKAVEILSQKNETKGFGALKMSIQKIFGK